MRWENPPGAPRLADKEPGTSTLYEHSEAFNCFFFFYLDRIWKLTPSARKPRSPSNGNRLVLASCRDSPVVQWYVLTNFGSLSSLSTKQQHLNNACTHAGAYVNVTYWSPILRALDDAAPLQADATLWTLGMELLGLGCNAMTMNFWVCHLKHSGPRDIVGSCH